MVRCLFGEPVGDDPSIDACPRWSDDCPCKLDLLCHALGNVDEQTTMVAAWWSDAHTFQCGEAWDRERLEEFR